MSATSDLPLTERQAEVLFAIYDCLVNREEYPTIRDLCKVLRIASPNGVVANLTALQKKGFLTLDPRVRSRGIRLTNVRMTPVVNPESPLGQLLAERRS